MSERSTCAWRSMPCCTWCLAWGHHRGSNRHRPWPSLSALARRYALGGEDLDHLHDAGALDCLLAGLGGSQRTWVVAAVGRQAHGHQWALQGQQRLALGPEAPDPTPPRLPPIPERICRRRRHDALGFLAEAHPLSLHDLPPRRLRCRDLTLSMRGSRVTLVAMAITRKQVTAHTRKVQAMMASRFRSRA